MTLSDRERAILDACFREVAEGPYFPDWEFPTLFGATRDAVRGSGRRWAKGKPSDEDHRIASQVIGNLVGYPHGLDKQLGALTGGSIAELGVLRDKLAASVS